MPKGLEIFHILASGAAGGSAPMLGGGGGGARGRAGGEAPVLPEAALPVRERRGAGCRAAERDGQFASPSSTSAAWVAHARARPRGHPHYEFDTYC